VSAGDIQVHEHSACRSVLRGHRRGGIFSSEFRIYPELGLTWKVGAVHTTLARGAGIIGIAVALAAAFGTGPAVASNEYVGETYNAAATAIANNGQTPVVASRFGTFLQTGACIVVSSNATSFVDGGGPSGKVLLHLNCNHIFALGSRGVPGNSMGNEAGRTARETAQQQAEQQYAEEQAKLKAEAEAEAQAAEQKDLPEGG
jgi:hypothetical protein